MSGLGNLGKIVDGNGNAIVQMFGPPQPQGEPTLAGALCSLTEVLCRGYDLEASSGGLAGEYGYGVQFENDVFLMHPYCWCEKPECLWCTVWLSNEGDHTQEESQAHRVKQTSEIHARFGEPHTKYSQSPHFWHKRSGLKVNWYKSIGREMEITPQDISLESVRDYVRECFDSIPQEIRDKAVREHDEYWLPENVAERERIHAAMFKALWEMMESEQPCAVCSEKAARGERVGGTAVSNGLGGVVVYTARRKDGTCINCGTITDDAAQVTLKENAPKFNRFSGKVRGKNPNAPKPESYVKS